MRQVSARGLNLEIAIRDAVRRPVADVVIRIGVYCSPVREIAVKGNRRLGEQAIVKSTDAHSQRRLRRCHHQKKGADLSR